MDSFRFLLVLIAAVLIAQDGDALKCWLCNSGGEVGCGDPFQADVNNDIYYLRDCENEMPLHPQFLPNGTTSHVKGLASGLEYFCIKLTGKDLGRKFVMRTCASGLRNLTKGSCMGSEPGKALGGYITTCDACGEDYCNGAIRVGSRAVLLAFFLLMSYSLLR